MNDLGSIPRSHPDSADTVPSTLRLLADEAGISEAAHRLRSGEIVAFPTETVYGLGADASDPVAVARIFAAKARPHFNPLIAHLPNTQNALREGMFDEAALRLAAAFWPGPLTLVVPASPAGTVCDLARAGLASVALRVPGTALARDLLARVGRPVAAPSANRSGRVSPTCTAHVLADLDGRIAAVLDGGTAPVGVESTVVACLGSVPRLLRHGGIPRTELMRVLGIDLPGRDSDAVDTLVGPGLLASHYAPRAQVRLNAIWVESGEAVLSFGGILPSPGDGERSLDLSPIGSLSEAATNLFAYLRRLDASGAAVIAVAPIPEIGLGEAINDRLRRAAAPR